MNVPEPVSAQGSNPEMTVKYEMQPGVNATAVDQSLIAQSDAIGDFQFGPNVRLEGETKEQYHIRMKTQRRMMRLRETHGIAAYNSRRRGAWKNPEKKMKQLERKIKKSNRIRISRAKRKEMGLL